MPLKLTKIYTYNVTKYIYFHQKDKSTTKTIYFPLYRKEQREHCSKYLLLYSTEKTTFSFLGELIILWWWTSSLVKSMGNSTDYNYQFTQNYTVSVNCSCRLTFVWSLSEDDKLLPQEKTYTTLAFWTTENYSFMAGVEIPQR